jgi:hypothetical protein
MIPDALEVAAAPLQVDEFWPDALAPRLAQFAAYLDRCRPADGALARLAAFDLLDVPDLVAHLILIDPVDDDRGNTRFRFRFVGTWHLLTFGQDVTGKFIDELYNDPLAMQAEQALHDILASGEPHYWRRPSVFHGQQYFLYQRIMAPLADEAGRIVRLAGCYDAADP